MKGKTFGNLRVLKFDHVDHRGEKRWLCICLLCGSKKVFPGYRIRHPRAAVACGCSEHRKPTPVAERMWPQVDKVNGPTQPHMRTRCWPWKGGTKHKFGYGLINVPTGLKGPKRTTVITTHRVAWVDTYGPIPKGKHVLHKCDYPPCCRPSHFKLGNQRSNMEDMVQKGRQAWGERNGHAKITNAEVAYIRRVAHLHTRSALARKFGVDSSAISMIVTGKRRSTGIL